MSKGVNKVILIGNLDNYPTIRHTHSGGTLVNLQLATREIWKDKKSNEQHEKTQWHKVVLFNKVAEIAAQFLKKGSKAYIEGSLSTKKWQDKEGNDRYITEIIATEFQVLDGKGFENNSANNSIPHHTITESNLKQSFDNDNFFDDEIPF